MTIVRYQNGILQDLPPDEALRLLKAGVVELAGPLPPVETAMLAPPETAMIPAAPARKRGRPKRARM